MESAASAFLLLPASKLRMRGLAVLAPLDLGLALRMLLELAPALAMGLLLPAATALPLPLLLPLLLLLTDACCRTGCTSLHLAAYVDNTDAPGVNKI